MYVYALSCDKVDPAVKNATTGKRESVSALIIENGQL
jgi:hypothetical protein